MPEQHREHQQLLFYTPKNCSERLSGNVAILELVHRSMEHRREARIGWLQSLNTQPLYDCCDQEQTVKKITGDVSAM
ncbi:hypothetical protein KYG_19098 [Acidovorax sp. NO-1]|nr:hypothetical protein KYG_19098 [Acidovorax sp. NO-1]